MSNENANNTNEAAADNATTKFPRYNYRGTVQILSQGVKDGKTWCKLIVRGANGKKKVEALAYDLKADAALQMAQAAGKDKVLNVFGYFNPNNTSTYKNKKGETVTVRQLQVLAVNWPLPPKAKAQETGTSEEAPTETGQTPAVTGEQLPVEATGSFSAASEDNPFE